MAVDGCPGYSECFGNLGGTLPVGMPGSGGCEGIGIHDCWAAAGAALGGGRGEACHGALADHVALVFGESGHHDEEEFPFSGRAVGSRQCSGENAQADSLVVEAVGDGEHFLHRPAETVQFPDAQGVRRTEMVERFNEPRACGDAAGDLVFEDPAAAGGFEGIALEMGVLSVGGNAGVTDEIELLGCHRSNVAQPSHNIAVCLACCETSCGRFLIGESLGPGIVSESVVSCTPASWVGIARGGVVRTDVSDSGQTPERVVRRTTLSGVIEESSSADG